MTVMERERKREREKERERKNVKCQKKDKKIIREYKSLANMK